MPDDVERFGLLYRSGDRRWLNLFRERTREVDDPFDEAVTWGQVMGT